MRIAITADPEIPVPPVTYGGIERIIFQLIAELRKRGHEVTLFAHRDSRVPCRLIAYPGTTQSAGSILKNSYTILKELAFGRYDVVHSFGRLAYLTPVLPWSLRKIMSYQREPTISQVKRAKSVSRRGSLLFTGCSRHISDKIKPYAPSFPIYNFVDVAQYAFREALDPDAPLVFLGRVEAIKGPDVAIAVAKAAGRKLVIAGNVPDHPKHIDFFNEKVKPFVDGNQISYVGPVNDEQKDDILGRSAALLMPIQWDEPFGIVMAEAMACGTPVIGFPRGAVPEVVEHGVSGFLAANADEMAECVSKLDTIKRANVRRRVEEYFSTEVVVRQYEQLYHSGASDGSYELGEVMPTSGV